MIIFIATIPHTVTTLLLFGISSRVLLLSPLSLLLPVLCSVLPPMPFSVASLLPSSCVRSTRVNASAFLGFATEGCARNTVTSMAGVASTCLHRRCHPNHSLSSLGRTSTFFKQYGASTVPRAAHRLAQDALHNDHQHRAALAHIPSAMPSPPHLAPVKHDFVLVHWEHDNQPPTVYGIQNPPTRRRPVHTLPHFISPTPPR
ncbi:hypothetical protein K438DRAFT_2007651 [Mycena galopus ATCC 62051]|nr:hypothetical protein K438DRAFT_2007651 [Mycena galopus ATCC 62051]